MTMLVVTLPFSEEMGAPVNVRFPVMVTVIDWLSSFIDAVSVMEIVQDPLIVYPVCLSSQFEKVIVPVADQAPPASGLPLAE